MAQTKDINDSNGLFFDVVRIDTNDENTRKSIVTLFLGHHHFIILEDYNQWMIKKGKKANKKKVKKKTSRKQQSLL